MPNLLSEHQTSVLAHVGCFEAARTALSGDEHAAHATLERIRTTQATVGFGTSPEKNGCSWLDLIIRLSTLRAASDDTTSASSDWRPRPRPPIEAFPGAIAWRRTAPSGRHNAVIDGPPRSGPHAVADSRPGLIRHPLAAVRWRHFAGSARKIAPTACHS